MGDPCHRVWKAALGRTNVRVTTCVHQELARTCTAIADSSSYFCQTKDLIADFGQPMSRNAVLASLKLYSQETIMETTGRKRFLEECVRYFSLYCTKETCYLDLQPCTACLSDPEKKDLMFSFVTAPENPPPQDVRDTQHFERCRTDLS